jgi:hypothetical protein
MEVGAADPYTTNPGPIDGSVLYDQDKHVSTAVWEGQVDFANCQYFQFHYLFHICFCKFLS